MAWAPWLPVEPSVAFLALLALQEASQRAAVSGGCGCLPLGGAVSFPRTPGPFPKTPTHPSLTTSSIQLTPMWPPFTLPPPLCWVQPSAHTFTWPYPSPQHPLPTRREPLPLGCPLQPCGMTPPHSPAPPGPATPPVLDPQPGGITFCPSAPIEPVRPCSQQKQGALEGLLATLSRILCLCPPYRTSLNRPPSHARWLDGSSAIPAQTLADKYLLPPIYTWLLCRETSEWSPLAKATAGD